jgi:hypothetical protein
MSHAAAAAAVGRKLHPVHVLAAALLLCCLSLLLHGQLQVHSQLRAAHKELAEIKYAVGASGHGSSINSGHTVLASSSSSATSSSGTASSAVTHNSSTLVDQLAALVRKQQKLLNSLPRGRNKELLDHVQQLSQEATSLLDSAAAAAAAAAASSSGSGDVPLQSVHLNASLNAAAAGAPGTLCLDITELLGLHQFMAGITWEPKVRWSQ